MLPAVVLTAGWLLLAWTGALPVGLDKAGLLLDAPPEACIPCFSLVMPVDTCVQKQLELSACTAIWTSPDTMVAITEITHEVAIARAFCTLDDCSAQAFALT